jgi:HD-like signal output (HDOD) protein
MDMIWIGAAGAGVVLAIAAFVRARVAPSAAAAPPAVGESPGAAPGAPSEPAPGPASKLPPAAPVADPPPPDVLARYSLIDASQLGADRLKVYVELFGKVPRPPRLLHHLLSPRLVNAASSSELVDLISAEPLIAAQVLGSVNTAAYGLPRTVTSVEQAVFYLGLNAVRILCLRYLMRATFRADTRQRRERLEELWQAGALAAEMAQRLSVPLDNEARGYLVSIVLLSFLGRLAVTAGMPRPWLAELPRDDPLERLHAEQARIGLSAGQIGRVLMVEWGLPTPVLEGAAAIETVPLRQASCFSPDAGALLALGYACARLGERLAIGALPDLLSLRLRTDPAPEWHHWREHLHHPALTALPEQLCSAELDEALKRHLTAP